MNKHIDIVGLLYIVFGAMGLVALIVQAVVIIFGTSLLAYNGEEASLIVGGIGFIILLITSIAAIPNLIVGYGLIKRRSWGRTFTIVWSVLNLFAVPFGTMLGGYAIWVMYQPEVVNQFNRSPASAQQGEAVTQAGV